MVLTRSPAVSMTGEPSWSVDTKGYSRLELGTRPAGWKQPLRKCQRIRKICLVPVRGRVAVGAAPAAVVHNSVASSFFIYLYLILSLRLSILVFHSFLCSNRIKQAFLKAMSASPAENCRTHPGLRLIFRLGGLLLLAGTRHWTSIQGIASCPGKLFCNILSKRLNQKLPSNICQTLRGSISSTPRASTKGWFNASEIVGRSAGSLISLGQQLQHQSC